MRTKCPPLLDRIDTQIVLARFEVSKAAKDYDKAPDKTTGETLRTARANLASCYIRQASVLRHPPTSGQ